MDCAEVRNIFVLFCEEVRYIEGAGYVFDVNRALADLFTYGVLYHLYMTKSFGGEAVCPMYTCRIIIVDHCGIGHDS